MPACRSTTRPPLTGLVIEGGRVVGVRAERDGTEVVIRARRGVILGSGGFEKSEALREKYLPAPTDAAWSTAAPEQHRRRHRGRRRHRRGDRPDGRRVVGPDDPAAVRPVVLPRRAQPPRLDHRQLRRQAVHERGAAVRRGDARDLRGRGHRRLARTRRGSSWTSAIATATCSPASPRGSRSPGVGTSSARCARPARSASSPRRSTYRPRRSRRPCAGSTGSPRPASTRTSTAARARTTATTPTRGSSPTRRCTASTADRSMPSRSSPATSAPRAGSSPTSGPARCGPTAR